MEILSSGSFVNLENQGKIEQLAYTAREIAAAAVETNGFVNEEENNKRLALEIWQGAEYMTRDHEEAQIKNVFINNFLDRLRELGGAPETALIDSENSAGTVEENSLDETAAPRDEFLGFVGTAEVSEQESAGQISPAEENALEPANQGVSAPISNAVTNNQEEKAGDNFVEPDSSLTEATPDTENAKPGEGESQKANQLSESGEVENIQAETSPKQSFGAITLPEKEPYQFDKCTVTATIQLLPTDAGIRRAVLSVRTHNFAPQISVVELNDGATPAQLLPALESAFERYKTDLPVKVMDKMKREKSAGKKQASKPTVETKSSLAGANSTPKTATKSETKSVQASVANSENNQSAATTGATSVEQSNSATSPTASANQSKSNAKTNKPDTSAQGNLFGF